jgi:hypothetical protein
MPVAPKSAPRPLDCEGARPASMAPKTVAALADGLAAPRPVIVVDALIAPLAVVAPAERAAKTAPNAVAPRDLADVADLPGSCVKPLASPLAADAPVMRPARTAPSVAALMRPADDPRTAPVGLTAAPMDARPNATASPRPTAETTDAIDVNAPRPDDPAPVRAVSVVAAPSAARASLMPVKRPDSAVAPPVTPFVDARPPARAASIAPRQKLPAAVDDPRTWPETPAKPEMAPQPVVLLAPCPCIRKPNAAAA